MEQSQAISAEKGGELRQLREKGMTVDVISALSGLSVEDIESGIKRFEILYLIKTDELDDLEPCRENNEFYDHHRGELRCSGCNFEKTGVHDPSCGSDERSLFWKVKESFEYMYKNLYGIDPWDDIY